MLPARVALAILTLTVVLFAGCTDSSGLDGFGSAGDNAPAVEATATTGGIRGVVVDDRITPIKGAAIRIEPGSLAIETDESGLFSVSGLQAGDYVVTASHPFYNEIQQTTTVVAGDPNPKAVKIQLTRLVFAQPYLTTEKFEGYIVCSAGHAFVGYSEECGEGVGLPGLGRVGGQSNNNVQYDFYVDSDMVRTIQLEMVWEPTVQSAASGELLTYVSTEWVCDPFCGGNTFVRGGSGSPMLLRADVFNGTASNVTACNCDSAAITTESVITAFTWANPDTVDPVTGEVPLPTVIQNQAYRAFITKSYVLPLPEGWSFVAEDPNPFV